MVRKILTIVMLMLAVALVSLPASAGLVPMSWGFPVLSQDRSLTAFERSFAQATDNEAATIAFPTSVDPLGCGSTFFGAAFPTITQTAVQTNLLTGCRFLQETERFAFAYPFISIGGAPVPSMGFL